MTSAIELPISRSRGGPSTKEGLIQHTQRALDSGTDEQGLVPGLGERERRRGVDHGLRAVHRLGPSGLVLEVGDGEAQMLVEARVVSQMGTDCASHQVTAIGVTHRTPHVVSGVEQVARDVLRDEARRSGERHGRATVSDLRSEGRSWPPVILAHP